jgi:MoaA/NifB/PqqE/SkfB family radical SAM enzyme
MEIQSLSVTVPTGNHCINKCPFCVSRLHPNDYPDVISECLQMPFMDSKALFAYKDYFNRLQFARDNGCNVVILTGTGEPLQNIRFLTFFGNVNSELKTPFKNIELQTTGTLINPDNLAFLRTLGVTTISFSVSNIFDDEKNMEIIGCANGLKFNLAGVIEMTRDFGFNVRISLNMLKDLDTIKPHKVLARCKSLKVDQVTFRELYYSNDDNYIDNWIIDNKSETFASAIKQYLEKSSFTEYLDTLPFGAKRYDTQGMSVVLDDNCMAYPIKQEHSVFKYLILRENCKLYSRWDTKASLIF